MGKSHLFIIDPFASLERGHDSSLALMKAALLAGHSVFCCELSGLSYLAGSLIAHASTLQLDSSAELELVSGNPEQLRLNESVQDLVVWMRKDPPVDEAYQRVCQLLALAHVPVLNNPNALLHCEEKLFALEYPDLIPRTWVSQKLSELKELFASEKKLVIKPIGGKAGEGILVMESSDMNLNSVLELLTERGRRKIILQEYLPAAREGDKRILLRQGDPVGAILRKPKASDHRANLAAGGSYERVSLSKREEEICGRLKPRLQQLGLYFVGIDVIGEKLTEINITSPTGLCEAGDELASQFIL